MAGAVGEMAQRPERTGAGAEPRSPLRSLTPTPDSGEGSLAVETLSATPGLSEVTCNPGTFIACG